MSFDKSWSLFLDRDGVINEKLDNDYVKNWNEFIFIDGALQAIAEFSKVFGWIFVVTNQRGVGLGLMTEEQLNKIHEEMCREVIKNYGKIDKVYYCTGIDDSFECRKPNIGMGLDAKNEFPQIEFSKSVVVGDSISDIEFGKNLGAKTVFIGKESEVNKYNNSLQFESLFDFYKRQVII